MTVWKLFNSLTLTFQSLQFRSYIKTTSFIPSLIKRNNTNLITSNKINIIFTVIKRKSKNSTQFFNHQSKITTFPKLFIQRNNRFTVRTSLKIIFSFKFLPYFFVIINLTIRSKNNLSIITHQRLFSRQRINNRKPLMTQNSIIPSINTTPVRTTMPDFFAHFQNLITQLFFQAFIYRFGTAV